MSLTGWGASLGLDKGDVIEKTRLRQNGRHVSVLKLAHPFRRVLDASSELRDELKIS